MPRSNAIYVGCEIRHNLSHWTPLLNLEIRFLSLESAEQAIIDKAYAAGITLVRYNINIHEEPFHTMFMHVRNLALILYDANEKRYYGVIKKTIPHNSLDSAVN